MSVLVLALALGGNPTQGARIAVEDDTLALDSARWGRSCSSLHTRFTNQGARLGELEGSRQFIVSISVMRTLRRANARSCAWAANGAAGQAGVAQVMMAAGQALRQAPCHQQAVTALEAAQSLPEAERDQAMDAAAVLLLSDDCEADTPEPAELDASDDEMEEEMDDVTDEIMDGLAEASDEGASLLEEGIPSLLPRGQTGLGGRIAFWWEHRNIGIGWQYVVGSILVGIVLGLICQALVHLLLRIFRWIRCNLGKLFGRSCSEYKPSTWLARLVGGGCHIGGIVYGAPEFMYMARL